MIIITAWYYRNVMLFAAKPLNLLRLYTGFLF